MPRKNARPRAKKAIAEINSLRDAKPPAMTRRPGAHSGLSRIMVHCSGALYVWADDPRHRGALPPRGNEANNPPSKTRNTEG